MNIVKICKPQFKLCKACAAKLPPIQDMEIPDIMDHYLDRAKASATVIPDDSITLWTVDGLEDILEHSGFMYRGIPDVIREKVDLDRSKGIVEVELSRAGPRILDTIA